MHLVGFLLNKDAAWLIAKWDVTAEGMNAQASAPGLTSRTNPSLACSQGLQ